MGKSKSNSVSLPLFLIFIMIIGVCFFSVYAHNRIDASRSEKLRDEVNELRVTNEDLRQSYADQASRHHAKNRHLEGTLLIMFPGEENKERITLLFHTLEPVQEEQATDAETPETLETLETKE